MNAYNPIIENAPAPVDERVKAQVQQLQALADGEPLLAEFMLIADTWASTLYRLSALEAFEAIQLQRAKG